MAWHPQCISHFRWHFNSLFHVRSRLDPWKRTGIPRKPYIEKIDSGYKWRKSKPRLSYWFHLWCWMLIHNLINTTILLRFYFFQIQLWTETTLINPCSTSSETTHQPFINPKPHINYSSTNKKWHKNLNSWTQWRKETSPWLNFTFYRDVSTSK